MIYQEQTQFRLQKYHTIANKQVLHFIVFLCVIDFDLSYMILVCQLQVVGGYLLTAHVICLQHSPGIVSSRQLEGKLEYWAHLP